MGEDGHREDLRVKRYSKLDEALQTVAAADRLGFSFVLSAEPQATRDVRRDGETQYVTTYVVRIFEKKPTSGALGKET